MIERKQAREERKGRKRQTDGEKEINRKIDVQINKKNCFQSQFMDYKSYV